MMMSRVEEMIVRGGRRGARVHARRSEQSDVPDARRTPFPRIEWVPSLNQAIGTDGIDG